MKKADKRGGRRPGAGRKRKWDCWFRLKVGQDCEKLFRKAIETKFAEEQRILLTEQSGLSKELPKAQDVEVELRSGWLEQEDGGDQYLWDVAAEIEQLNIVYKNQNLENRVFSLPVRPRRGTRKAIIEQIAIKYSLTENQVDNFWQAYRRFEKSIGI
jgi:hypothetical protein